MIENQKLVRRYLFLSETGSFLFKSQIKRNIQVDNFPPKDLATFTEFL